MNSDTDTLDRHLRSSEVTKNTGITSRTLRYWEEIGIVVPVEGPAGTERRYLPDILETIETVRALQESLGFSLTEIKQLIDADRALTEVRTVLVSTPTALERVEALRRASEINMSVIEQLRNRRSAVDALLIERLAKQSRIEAGLGEASLLLQDEESQLDTGRP